MITDWSQRWFEAMCHTASRRRQWLILTTFSTGLTMDLLWPRIKTFRTKNTSRISTGPRSTTSSLVFSSTVQQRNLFRFPEHQFSIFKSFSALIQLKSTGSHLPASLTEVCWSQTYPFQSFMFKLTFRFRTRSVAELVVRYANQFDRRSSWC